MDPRGNLRGTGELLSVFVDTNVFVYLYDRTHPDKQRIARSTLADQTEDIVISTQVLSEFFWVATRKLNLDPQGARDIVGQMAALRVVPIDHRLVILATDTSLSARISIWDALIIEAAAQSGSYRLLSEDLNEGQTIRGVQTFNPFAHAN